MKRTTLADIAKHCNVSINTVSHALNDKPDISEATKQVIRQAAVELGYIQNSSASFLRSGISKTIAIILGDISNPHFAIVVKEMEAIARRKGYTTFILNTEEDENLEREAIVAAISKNVDGIILCPVQKSRKNVEFLLKSKVPFTLIGRRFPSLPTNYVILDDTHSGYIAAEYILKRNNRRTAVITAASYVSSAKERLQGIMDCFKQQGIALPEEDIYSVPLSPCKRGSQIRRIAEKDYDSAICFNDMLALELLSYAPSIDIVSFDNIRSKFIMPYEFASVSSSKTKMSETAVRILLDAIDGKEGPVQKVLPTTILTQFPN